MLSCLKLCLKWGIILTLLVFVINYWLQTKSYVFTEKNVAEIGRKYSVKAGDVGGTFKKIHEEFQKRYPGHILPKEDLQWIFVNAGGWMGSMCLIHASLTEYVLFFGTALEIEGHSGRYWANISDTLIQGEFRQWEEGNLKANVYKTGDTILHVVGEATAVNFKADTWMVEYGRGFIPSTLGFALSDTLFSTQDFLTMFYTFRIYTKAMIYEAAANLRQLGVL